MTEIKLTEENFGEIDDKGWYHLHVTKPVKQQILDDHKENKQLKQKLELLIPFVIVLDSLESYLPKLSQDSTVVAIQRMKKYIIELREILEEKN